MSTLAIALAAVSCWLSIAPRVARFAVPLPALPAQSHYERPTTKGGPYSERVVVFVHGIFGDADSTWRYSPSIYWPKLLLRDSAFRDADVYVAAYSSPYFGNTMSLDEVVTNLNNRLVSDEVFSKHREVVFVCHSLGGLVVQRLLLTFRQYAQQVPFIYFFSTPETGAQIANLGSVFSSDPLLKTMFVGNDNGNLLNLENEWKSAQFHIHRLCAYEKKKYKGVLVVDRLSGTRNCDESPIAINEDHLGIVKPSSAEHDSYIALRNAILSYPIARGPRTPAATRQPPAAAGSTKDDLNSRVLELKRDIVALRGDYETIPVYGKPVRMKVNEMAPRLADKMLDVKDAQLALSHKVVKYEYACYALMMAASTEENTKRKLEFADRSAESCDASRKLLAQAENSQDTLSKSMWDWLREDDTKYRVDYLSAIDYCIKAKEDQSSLWKGKVKELLDGIPPYFKDLAPPETNPDLKECLI